MWIEQQYNYPNRRPLREINKMMKSVKLNGRPARGTGRQGKVRFEQINEGSTENKGQEMSRVRMLENLKLALFFCQAQGRMARGE